MANLKMSCESILLKSTGKDLDSISPDELEVAMEICNILQKHDVSHYRAKTILCYTEIMLSATKISNQFDDCYHLR